jgi:hypothetical protein
MTNGQQPEGPTPAIVVAFDAEGEPQLSIAAGTSITRVLAAAKQLERFGTIQLDMLLVQQLQAQGPRVVTPTGPRLVR